VAGQSAWLRQNGISPQEQNLGTLADTPDVAMRRAASPGRNFELNYGGYAAPGTRIFGGYNPNTPGNTGKMNSFTGAGLPGYGGGGGGTGGGGLTSSQAVTGQLLQMSQRLSQLGGSGNTRDLLERREILRNMDALSKVHATLSGHEIGQMQIGEQTRSSKQRERATAAAQAFALPTAEEAMAKVRAMQDPDTYRNLMAAQHGAYAQPKMQPWSPIGMVTPGMGVNGMPTYYGSPEVGANIDAMNVYPYQR